MSKPQIHTFKEKEEIALEILKFVIQTAKQCIQEKGKFTLALSGGSQPMLLAKGIDQWKECIDTKQWHIFFADERYVPLDHQDSNYNLWKTEVFPKLNIPNENIHTMLYGNGLHAAAEDYENQLVKCFGADIQFDLILLGIGPDGHTCSLFPNHSLLKENQRWISYLSDSPKPPPERITFTFRVLNHANMIAFTTTGKDKGNVIKQIFSLHSNHPASMVNCNSQHVHWFTDEHAVSEL